VECDPSYSVQANADDRIAGSERGKPDSVTI
jgi:hypothetical protein